MYLAGGSGANSSSGGGSSVAKSAVEQTAFASLGLSAPTMRAMSEGFKYVYATPVQAAAIPVALKGTDVLAS
jgi:superfamily II DNA/RNA helicase